MRCTAFECGRFVRTMNKEGRQTLVTRSIRLCVTRNVHTRRVNGNAGTQSDWPILPVIACRSQSRLVGKLIRPWACDLCDSVADYAYTILSPSLFPSVRLCVSLFPILFLSLSFSNPSVRPFDVNSTRRVVNVTLLNDRSDVYSSRF